MSTGGRTRRGSQPWQRTCPCASQSMRSQKRGHHVESFDAVHTCCGHDKRGPAGVLEPLDTGAPGEQRHGGTAALKQQTPESITLLLDKDTALRSSALRLARDWCGRCWHTRWTSTGRWWSTSA